MDNEPTTINLIHWSQLLSHSLQDCGLRQREKGVLRTLKNAQIENVYES